MVAGWNPVVLAVPIVVVLALTGLLAGKVKGDEMDTRNTQTACSYAQDGDEKTKATGLIRRTRKIGGQILLVMAAMGSSWTAGNVLPPL